MRSVGRPELINSCIFTVWEAPWDQPWHVSIYFPKLHVYEDKPKSAGKLYNIHKLVREERGALKADARRNGFALRTREGF